MPGHCQGQNGLQAYERHTKEEKAKIKKKSENIKIDKNKTEWQKKTKENTLKPPVNCMLKSPSIIIILM